MGRFECYLCKATGTRCAFAHASRRTPVAVQETLIPGLPVILNWLFEISSAMYTGAKPPNCCEPTCRIIGSRT